MNKYKNSSYECIKFEFEWHHEAPSIDKGVWMGVKVCNVSIADKVLCTYVYMFVVRIVQRKNAKNCANTVENDVKENRKPHEDMSV